MAGNLPWREAYSTVSQKGEGNSPLPRQGENWGLVWLSLAIQEGSDHDPGEFVSGLSDRICKVCRFVLDSITCIGLLPRPMQQEDDNEIWYRAH